VETGQFSGQNGKEMFAMIIESQEIARAQRAIFELAWKGAASLEA
jgi:hypothetical protein